jgi:hypothetical protein
MLEKVLGPAWQPRFGVIVAPSHASRSSLSFHFVKLVQKNEQKISCPCTYLAYIAVVVAEVTTATPPTIHATGPNNTPAATAVYATPPEAIEPP